MARLKHFFETGMHLAPPTIEERVAVAKRHLTMAMDWKGERLGLLETRRHYTNYFKGIPYFKEYRLKLVTADDFSTIEKIFEEISEQFSNRVL